ncbi:MAG: hypothetical protein ABSF56_02875 [Minisyncoccia bacterium]|jgi:hypothetical protein
MKIVSFCLGKIGHFLCDVMVTLVGCVGIVVLVVLALLGSLWGNLCDLKEFGIPDLLNKLKKRPTS